jgi:dynein heavy chain 1, cytosolic
LETKALESQDRSKAIDLKIESLEKSITIYKEEYAVLISDTQALKKEMDLVKTRVDRSVNILSNLSSEKDRWEDSRSRFGVEMEIVGDVLISTAFLTYAGYFDQFHRESLLKAWRSHFKESGIKSHKQLSVSDYLTTAEKRNCWFENSLPADQLCVENALILDRQKRFPLIIDPSNQALIYLQQTYKKSSLAVTR